jgi:heme/copper-type cytochrome/quinol oxidase subunit 4
MTRQTAVFFIGIVLTIIPFLGVPLAWREYSVAIIGVLLILIGYGLRREIFFARIDKGNGERGTDSFVETTERLFSDQGTE